MAEPTYVCPDCGFTQPQASHESYQACEACYRNNPDPIGGWPVVIRWSGKKGRGVFLTENVGKGTMVERCHAIPFSLEEGMILPNVFPTLGRYVFPWTGGRKAFLSGCGLLYNYDTPKVTGKAPSVVARIRRGLLAVEFLALRDLRIGDELTFDYRDIRQYKPG